MPVEQANAPVSAILQIDIDSKRFVGRDRSHVALRDLRLTVYERQFVCLVGPSGCGKSTLLNIINGLDPDFQGRLQGRLDERADTDAPGGGTGTGTAVATMFQTPRLMPWLTVLENVLLVLDDSPASVTRARALLEAMQLGDVLHAYPKQLSGGMQRRVALARAFAVRPRLLLMDEPFISLDLPTANRLRAMLVELWQAERASVLFVTHDLREALALADRVVFLSGSPGRVVLDIPVDLPRPRDPEMPAVQALQRQLLGQHPDLLAGLLGPAGAPADPGRPDPGRPDPGRPDPGRPDPGRPDPDDSPTAQHTRGISH